MAWLRLYTDVAHDPKVQRLHPALFKFWITILCLAKENGGTVPVLSEVAYVTQRSRKRCESATKSLQKRGLLDDVNGTLVPHNWDGRQYKSDDVTARVKRFRERSSNVSETPPETETETETEQSSDPSDRVPPAPASPRQRFFKSGSRGKQIGALIDEARAHGYELDASHAGGMLKRYPKGAVWDALVKAQGEKAANYESFMERILSDGGANRRTGERAPSGHHEGDDGGGTDEHPASPFAGMGRQAGSSGEET